MMKSETWKDGISGVLVLVCLAAGSLLFTRGPLGDYVKRQESLAMFLELGLFFLWNVFWLSRGKAWKRDAGVLASFVVFLWLHQALVPVVVSGLYLAVIIKLGNLVRRCLYRGQEKRIALLLLDFQTGYTVWLVLVCICSAFGVGSIRSLRILFLGLALCGGLHSWYRIRKQTGQGSFSRWQENLAGGPADQHRLIRFAVPAGLFFTAWMIQIGRMNIAMDYDSLHYGLRSAYILDNGRGIYQNLGNINLVYTYSKGLEVLGLPLAGTATYGYTLALNLWLTVLVFTAVGLIAGQLAGKSAGRLAVFLSAGIPALMNMSITAKSDNLTLVFQLLCLYGCMRCLGIRHEEETDQMMTPSTPPGGASRKAGLWLPAAAYILTLTLKPTAIVFSTVLFGFGILYLIYRERGKVFRFLPLGSGEFVLFLAAVAALLGIWARTLILTGVPMTSIFTGIFEKIGFRVKEPFAFMSVPSNGTALTPGAALQHLLQRLFGVLLAPAGEDMAHVVIAWGGSMITFLIYVCIAVRSGKKQPFIKGLTLVTGLVSLISLYLLWQVDGNYYLLLYLLVVFLAVGVIEHKPRLMVFVMPLFCFQLSVMSLTNWAGVTGMTPVKVKHSGWYNHQEANYQHMCETGNQQIWNRLAADPRTTVIAFGEHPEVLCFPCNVQSYYDVTGSGGNVWLVKKLDYFKSFLDYAGTEYIYAQAGYLEDGSRAEEIIRFMIEDGSLQDIVYENGNLLGRVVLAPEQAGAGERTPAEETERYNELYGRSAKQ